MNYTLALTSTPLLVASEQEEEKVESMRTDREDLTEPKRRHKQKLLTGWSATGWTHTMPMLAVGDR